MGVIAANFLFWTCTEQSCITVQGVQLSANIRLFAPALAYLLSLPSPGLTAVYMSGNRLLVWPAFMSSETSLYDSLSRKPGPNVRDM